MHSRVRLLAGAVLLAGALITGSTVPAQAASAPTPLEGNIQSPSVGHYRTVDDPGYGNGCSDVASEGGHSGSAHWDFHAACNGHDECYRDYGGPNGSLADKATCDNNFYEAMKATCNTDACLRLAWVYYMGVQGSAATSNFLNPDPERRKGDGSLN